VTAHHFAGAGLLEPLGRTFMSLEFRHRNSVDLSQQVRLKNYSTAGSLPIEAGCKSGPLASAVDYHVGLQSLAPIPGGPPCIEH
jgi:hypothetical protein